MSWKPKKWISVVLALLFQPLSMLYLGKLKWAFIYFAALIVIASVEFILLNSENKLWTEYFTFNLLLRIICIIHSYKIAKSYIATDQRRPWYSRWYGLSAILAGLIVSPFSFLAFLYEAFIIPSVSMYPNIERGTVLIAQKYGYGNYRSFGITLFKTDVTVEIHRGDLVVFQYPKDKNIDYMKRVIGLPGDHIEYENKEIIINGKKVETVKLAEEGDYEIFEERLDKSVYKIARSMQRKSFSAEFTVPENHYFVMGDNRDNSNDSRFWGYVPSSHIVGGIVYAM